MELIYHICSRNAWETASSKKDYWADPLISEGFIHCSTIHQVPRVLNTFYSDENDLLLLEIDTSSLSPNLRWEPGTDKAEELFPHVYGSLNKDAILRVIDINKDTVNQLIQSAG